MLDKAVVFSQIDGLRQEMIEALMSLISVPAVAPENGGDGEAQKAKCLVQLLERLGFDKVECYNAPDGRVSCGGRPNVVAYLFGVSDERRLWIVSHLDVVPPGKVDAWTETLPFSSVLCGDRVVGRGSEDNGQSLVSSIFALRALKLLGVKPAFTVGLVFVADEEQGSTYGIQYLLKQQLFKPNDFVVVSDAGNAAGDFIEVAEKSLLWLKLCVMGKQVHGSRPDKGLNAHRIGMDVALALDRLLHEKYSKVDALFDVPNSTFEPTRKECNVEAVNIIPGEDITYFDCRILPVYNLDEVLEDINQLLRYYEEKTRAKITLELLQKQSSPILNSDTDDVVLRLKTAIKHARGIDASVGGVGGGTCAAFFRQQGIHVAVWCTIDGIAHQPNEYARVSSMIADAKVFALLAMG
ncbi:MAG: M20 family metallo-hydrolase [Nitrososphaerota archaeon]|jgi:succinyl-diaminopimelate desuccinylase|nr:M20 family metallo-hydrolase [Nitrososphaerota archaeon]